MWKQFMTIILVSLMMSPAMARRGRRVSNETPAQKVQQETSVNHLQSKAQIEEPAKTDPKVVEEKDQKNLATSQVWKKGKATVIQLKGQASEDSASCSSFWVRITEQLDYNIDCVGHEMSGSFDLENGANRTVTQKGEHITMTQYAYLMKNPRVSTQKQTTLKVPFVEKIIHIKKMEDGSMAFYYESFKEDEFGRIVQDGFVQAHSLAKVKMKISKK